VVDGAAGVFEWQYSAADVIDAGQFTVQFTAVFPGNPTPARLGRHGDRGRIARRFAGHLPERAKTILIRSPVRKASFTLFSGERLNLGIFLAAGFLVGHHAVNQGICSRFDFARQILETAGWGEVPVEPIVRADLGLPCPRPPYSPLDNLNLRLQGFPPMRHYLEPLREYVSWLLENEAF
jgi:hypothetical protein